MSGSQPQPDLYRELVAGVFKTELPAQDSADIAQSYEALKQLNSRYGEKSLLGKGALKEVYQRTDLMAKREVAWATLRREHPIDYYDAFIHEAWLTASLQHPNIIKIHEVGIDEDSRPYFTMDLKSEGDLSDYVGKATLREKLDVFMTICAAMSYAHAQGVLHLDLKPQNIQCDQYGEVLICDWGLGKFSDAKASRTDFEGITHTLIGEVKGSLGFMAPEQAGGSKDERTDIYALGALLYYLLCEQAPHIGNSRDELLEHTLHGDIRNPREIEPQLPKALCSIAMRALSRDPVDRYPSVEDLRTEVTRYLDNRATLAEQPNLFNHLLLFTVRHAKVVTLITSFTLCLSLLIWWNARRLEDLDQRNNNSQEKAAKISESYQLLNSEYQAFELAMTDSSDNLARKLSSAALERFRAFQGLYDYGFALAPADLINEMELLASKSHRLAPVGHTKIMLLQCYMVQMNFRAVMENDLNVSHPKFNKWYEIAKSTPSFAFNGQQRPSSEQYREFLSTLQKESMIDKELLRLIFFYDLHTRQDFTHYPKLLEAHLNTLHHDTLAEVHYSPENDEFLVTGIDELHEELKYSSTKVLSLLNSRLLTIKGHTLRMSRLVGIRAKELDLSGVAKFNLNSNLTPTDLERVTITAEQLRSYPRIKATFPTTVEFVIL